MVFVTACVLEYWSNTKVTLSDLAIARENIAALGATNAEVAFHLQSGFTCFGRLLPRMGLVVVPQSVVFCSFRDGW